MFALIRLNFSKDVDSKELISKLYGSESVGISVDDKKEIIGNSQFYRYKSNPKFFNAVVFAKEIADSVLIFFPRGEKSLEINIENSDGVRGIGNLKKATNWFLIKLKSALSSLRVRYEYLISIVSGNDVVAVARKAKKIKKIGKKIIEGMLPSFIIAVLIFGIGSSFGIANERASYAILVALSGLITVLFTEVIFSEDKGDVYEDP
jgi:hypothetical protein